MHSGGPVPGTWYQVVFFRIPVHGMVDYPGTGFPYPGTRYLVLEVLVPGPAVDIPSFGVRSY